ncbi:HipA domain-containing protein [Flavobacterium sp. WC2509]|uniref:HipA domain-containing protein n=1 Tax=Flavobacterium sp. WC2509 TaxID=3461406 RepID=UPI0040446E7D
MENTAYGRIGIAYYLMAKACEIEMMECRLMEENGRTNFITKRFDRQDGDTKHQARTYDLVFNLLNLN